MNYIVIDTENSGAHRNKAHPFDPRNRLLLLGEKGKNWCNIHDIEYSGLPYGNAVRDVGERIRSNGVTVVGFNLKYDLHWLNRYGISVREDVKLWDCQAAEFLLSNQTWSYPSLGEACINRGVSTKKDILTEYLSQGLDVSDIPLGELTEYLEGDLVSTEELFLKQVDLIEAAGLSDLMDLQMQDLLVLAEMEWNGLKYDLQLSLEKAKELATEEATIIKNLDRLVMAPVGINWNSGDHISAILYGGKIGFDSKEPVGVYKTGAKAGMPKYRNVTTYTEFPRLVEPLASSELAKDGYWSTAENTLKELKPKGKAKEIIENLQTQSKINKLRTTYFEGIPKKFEFFGWEDGVMHPQINQCVARTGRLSSSNPNEQNMDPKVKECIVSRYNG